MPDKDKIEALWERRQTLSPDDREARDTVRAAYGALDSGAIRVAEKAEGGWRVNAWVKQAILLGFRLFPKQVMQTGTGPAYDRIPLKFEGWQAADFEAAGIRAVPGALVRLSAHIEAGAVLMPSYVNVGARVGAGTMVDTWATVGSCAQIGRNCHISGGAGIGGVLEPLQANPVIVEDDCFIGARSEVAEGVIIEEGAVLAMGTYLAASTSIIDRATGKVTRGRVPAGSVVIPGTLPARDADTPALYAAVIVKQVDAKTREKVGINALLREAGGPPA